MSTVVSFVRISPVDLSDGSAVVGFDMFHQQPVLDLGGSLSHLSSVQRAAVEQGEPDRYSSDQLQTIENAVAGFRRGTTRVA